MRLEGNAVPNITHAIVSLRHRRIVGPFAAVRFDNLPRYENTKFPGIN